MEDAYAFTLTPAQFAAAVRGTRAGLRRSRFMTSPRTLYVEPDGLRLASAGSDLVLRWPQLAGAAIEGPTLYLDLDAVSYCPVPLSAFGSEAEAREFVAFVNARCREAATGSDAARAQLDLPLDACMRAPVSRPRAPRRVAPALLATVRDALRLALFRPLPEGRPWASWGAVLAAALASLAVPVAVALYSVGMHGEWSWYSLSSALLHVPMLLGAAILAAYAVGRPAQVPRYLMAGLLVSIVIDVATAALWLAMARQPVLARVLAPLAWLPPAWLALALAAFVARAAEPAGRRLAVVACCIVLVGWPLATIYRDREMWHAPYSRGDDDGTAAYGPAAEDVFYRQPTLLADALRAVRTPVAGRTNVYFVGMAGYGGQDVFRREVDAVARIFRERFGAEGHVVELINNTRTLLDAPIASTTSLRAALKRVAEVMDRERDVLVLYMTSHGSGDHKFSLSLWPLRFHDLDPAALRALLDESGIRNRVVIVAACYSGGFVKPLAGPNTLVITAAAADRTSFGCSNEAEWTYFGKAYFDEALRHTHSFTRAFEMARPRIAERERRDEFDPSNPQMSVGAGIAAKLEALERELDGAGRPRETPLRLASPAGAPLTSPR